jgi:hypothetical protein
MLRAIVNASLLCGLLLGCNKTAKNNAPVAPLSFGGAVQQRTPPDAGYRDAGYDAGYARDGALPVCSPGQQSTGLAFSANDPCNQSASSCSLSGATAISTCQGDGTWDPDCFCFAIGGIAGMAGITGGAGASGTGF